MFWRADINPEKGPFRVEMRKGDFHDESRGRKIPYKMYYPVAHNLKKLPIIIWSHGFGGNRDGAAFLSRYLATQGYILVHITHTGTDSSIWEGKPGHPWDILRKHIVSRETTLNRFHDVPFTLNRLEKWAKENPEAGTYMDFKNIGISGHSFGALTSQVMAGMLFPNEDNVLTSYYEPRFKAGILYSPITIEHLEKDTAASTDVSAKECFRAYNEIKIPLLHMTGTDDDSPISGADYKHRLEVYDNTGHPEKALFVKKDGDHMVYNGTRGKLEANPKRELHESLIKVCALAYWDTYLRQDKRAKEWLNSDIQNWLGEEAEFKCEMD